MSSKVKFSASERRSLREAADYIEAHGWWQNGFHPSGELPADDGPACLLGALGKVTTGYRLGPPAGLDEKLQIALGKYAGRYNDELSPTRGKRTVINRLRKLASKETK